jgi:raffinose/stachyose/melibiose transport system substrate-binding protein
MKIFYLRGGGNMKKIAVLLLLVLLAAAVFGTGKTDTASGKPVLVVWDQFYPASQDALMKELIAGFESQHNCVVQRTLYTTEQLRATLRTALASGTGPDIFYYDAGPAFLGAFANAGLVYDLTGAYQRKGWNNTLAKWTVERTTYNGKKWGVPHEIEFTCLYYNKNILRQLGFENRVVKIPGSTDLYTLTGFNDYLAILDAAKKAGYISLSLGMRNNPGYGGHLFSYLATVCAGKDKIDNILFGNGSWEDPAIIQALTYFQDFQKQGYYTPSPNSVSYDETNALFFGGRIATNPAGTWLIADILDQVPNPDDIGLLLLPPVSGNQISAASGLGSCFGVASSTKNPDLAVEFLDYITNKTSSEKWINQGQVIPANTTIDLSSIKLSRMMAQAIEGASLNHAYNLDVVMPAEWNDAMTNGLQALVNGTDTPAGVASKMQRAWSTAKAAGNIWKAN